ncbi:MAG: short-chain fatty acid transporter [Spirochaetaceae bacterium]|nr:short-chain fatty acid transporter [Myxococcales bacterium]MCB9725170.1 short-chain fatty acid transporter [Spirochaetaceae bacterium]
MRLDLDRLARPFVVLSERYYPDPFVFAIALTAAAFALAIGVTSTSPLEALAIWGGGLTGLLAFTTQVGLTLVCAHALAHTDVVRRAIERVAARPATPPQAYALVALLAGGASLLAGALGLVVGALSALAVAEQGRRRGLRLHFPLLVASAYSGFLIWHMGYSGSIPLLVATPGHMLESSMGLVPITQTTFSAANLALAGVTLAATAFLCSRLEPTASAIVELPPRPTSGARDGASAVPASDGPGRRDGAHADPPTPGERLDRARALSVGLGVLLLAYLVAWFAERGFALTFDLMNWSFLCAGLLAARSPRHYVDLIVDASRTVGPVILMYPLYAGVMALITGTELVGLFSDGFVAIASPRTLGFWAFVSGGLVNVFVPSGGGQWAVQGPVFIEAAKELGVAFRVVVLGVAYGDQWTNLIQPFWTLPLLAIVGLDARAIMGYCFVVFAMGFVLLGGGLLLIGAG